MQSSDGWSQTARAYSSDSIVQIPAYFAKVAADMLLQDFPADGAVRFLDIAAGTGTLTGEILNALTEDQRSGSSFDITDFSPGMVATAESEIAKLDTENKVSKKFQVMDGQALEFPEHSFSHVGCQFGVMFFPNRQKGFSEMYRVLQLDGTAVVLTWNYTDNLPLLLELSSYLQIPNLEPIVTAMNNILSACGEPADFEAELEQAGFRDITVTKVERVFSLANNEELFLGFATNPAMKAFIGGEDKYNEWQEFLRTVGSKWLNEEGRLCLKFVANIALAKK